MNLVLNGCLVMGNIFSISKFVSAIAFTFRYVYFQFCRCPRLEKVTCLPQKEENHSKRAQRARKLERVRIKYQLEQKTFGFSEDLIKELNIIDIPPILHDIPMEEQRRPKQYVYFSGKVLFYKVYQNLHNFCHRIYHSNWILRKITNFFLLSLSVMRKITAILLLPFYHPTWTVRRMINFLSSSCVFYRPEGLERWESVKLHALREKDLETIDLQSADHWFAWKRMNGVNRGLIKAVKDIPHEFHECLNDADHPYLKESSLDKKQFFVVDLTHIALEAQNKKERTPTPVALFVVHESKLMPVAIFDKCKNKVFSPIAEKDKQDKSKIEKWTIEKMKFDMMDAQYHESITHLGFTHLLMEGVSVCAHRNLSERHPILKLLAPHFRYMHSINIEIGKLLDKNGYVDEDMWISRETMMVLVAKHNQKWRLDKQGSFLEGLKERNVESEAQLPGYFFRDDAKLIHKAIENFVSNYVNLYYDDSNDVEEDYELQDFREELTKKRNFNGTGGCGIQGVPEFDNIDNVVTTLTNFIFICSVEHSAANFPQFDQYGFPPNFPATLELDEEKNAPGDIDALMPKGAQFLSTLSLMKILTMVITNHLGHYETEYTDVMDAKALEFLDGFQKELNDVERIISARNDRIKELNSQNPKSIPEFPYKYLLPKNVLNSISI